MFGMNVSHGRSASDKRVAIVQSSYIPWKGYFDLIRAVDEFILFDDVQYTRRDWRNRNRIKTRDGVSWLSIPVTVRGRYAQRIKDTVVSDPEWARRHWRTLIASYSKAPFFGRYRGRFEGVYEGIAPEPLLSRINEAFIREVCAILEIQTKITTSMDYDVRDGKTERLVDLCRQAGASEYLSGPSARSYIETELFERAGIRLRFGDYSGYPEYPQLHPPFEHRVTVLDLIFNVGPEARRYLLSL